MKRALITGITGQDGRYLGQLLAEKGYQVFGLIRGQQNPKTELVQEENPKLELIEGDLTDLSSLIAAIEQTQPDEVYNLGAISFVQLSFRQAELTAETTGLGVLRMLEAVRIVGGTQNNPMRFYQASSSEMFGKVRETPQTEQTPFHPRSPYGVAKVFGHDMTVNYRESYDIHASSGILFNHECVPADSPVVVRRHGLIDIAPIGDLVPHRTDPSKGKRYTSDGGDLEVWDGSTWSRCTARTATWHDEEISTIHGRGGVVEATHDHVVFLADGERPAGEVATGDRLLLADQPSPAFETTLTDDEAWLLGALAAEGYVSPDGNHSRLTCSEDEFLAEAARCWERVTAGYAVKTEGPPSGFSDGRTPTLELNGAGAYLRMVRDELYTRDGKKRIPVRVLNASIDLQVTFLRAYNLGDGLRAGGGVDELKSFRSASPTLACGLVWLARTTLGRRVSLYRQVNAGGTTSYLVNLSSSLTPGRKGAHLRKPQDEVRRVDRRHYEGWMCDLATESGRFAAGVGLVVVHNSPKRGLEFVTRKITNSLARLKLGLQDSISLGNLESSRDWGFAGDYVDAMWRMLQQDEPGDYVVATGETHTIREFLDVAFRIAGYDSWEPHVRHDDRFERPAEVDVLIGDSSLARAKLGWKPTVGFEELVKMMYEHDLAFERSKMENGRS